MLSENAADLLPERVCLAALIVLTQRGEPVPVIPALWGFCRGCADRSASSGHDPRAQHPAVWTHRLDLAPHETRA
jgi:hypothetical protein